MTMFPFTLWHGTSAHLLPMIQQHGLGGKNLMTEWGVFDFLREAFPLIGFEEHRFDDPDYDDLMVIHSAVRGGADGMNFEYGDVYAAGSFQKAADYALSAPELTSLVSTLLRIAEQRGNSAVLERLKGYVDLAEFVGLEPAPVVLKLPPLPMERVLDERGGKKGLPKPPFEDLMEAFWHQMAFRITGIIPFEEIEVIDAKDHERTVVF